MSSKYGRKRLWVLVKLVGLLSATTVLTGSGCPDAGGPGVPLPLRHLVFEAQWPAIPAGAVSGIVDDLQDGTRTLGDVQLRGPGPCEFIADFEPESPGTSQARLVFYGTPCTPGFSVYISGFRWNPACSTNLGPTPRSITIHSDQDLPVGQTTRDGYALVETTDGETYSSIGLFFEFELAEVDYAAEAAMGSFEFMARNENDPNDNTILVVINGSFRMRIECGDPSYCDLTDCASAQCGEGFTFDPETGNCVAEDLCADSDCPVGFRCDPETGGCVTPEVTANRCANVSCPEGSACDPETGECVDENDGGGGILSSMVFQSNRPDHGIYDIWTVRADGTGQTQFTDNEMNEVGPVISPTGLKVVFYRNSGIWVMDFGGANVQQLTQVEGAMDTDPTFDSTGQKILWTRSGNLWVMDLDGQNAGMLTSLGLDHHPSVSPDGTKIVFSSQRDLEAGSVSVHNVWVADFDGSTLSNPQAMTSSTSSPSNRNPTWSSDGTKIAFDSTDMEEGASDIWIMNADGSNAQNLTRDGDYAYDSEPAFSPDGTRIAYASTVAGVADIWLMKPDGTGKMNLTNDTFFDGHPSFDGSP